MSQPETISQYETPLDQSKGFQRLQIWFGGRQIAGLDVIGKADVLVRAVALRLSILLNPRPGESTCDFEIL